MGVESAIGVPISARRLICQPLQTALLVFLPHVLDWAISASLQKATGLSKTLSQAFDCAVFNIIR